MAAERLNEVFFALADATRRSVIRRLLEADTLTATQLAADLPMTRQAVTKHLSALTAAGLVTAHREGRETRYELAAASLDEAASWLQEVGDEWERRLERRRHSFEPGA